jgi:hypothetical protein
MIKMAVDRLRSAFDVIESMEGRPRPKKWEEVVGEAAREVTGCGPILASWYLLLRPRIAFFSWGPSLRVLVTGLLGRQAGYLCWGIPRAKSKGILLKLKRLRLKLILRGAKIILVNESSTQRDIKELTGRESRVVPYIVDAEFFRFGEPGQRNEFVLVPGNNDRDEELVRQISRAGRKVIRVTSDPKVVAQYRSIDSDSTVQVLHNIGYEKLRTLYQTAFAVALPLKGWNHPAGQTALLEAVASGAPVVVTRGRIFEQISFLASVTVCEGNTLAEWLQAFERPASLIRTSRDMLYECSLTIARLNSPFAVKSSIVEVFKEALIDTKV